MKMNLPKELENDVVRLKEILNKAFAKAPKKELNEMIWDLVVSNLPKEEVEEIATIVNNFSECGVQFNIAPNFQIIAFIPANSFNGKRDN